ncbi:HET-domain-containing protein [Thozetella sp. PMI_491]|nr:HET-domain-containing protein [Thozetella sp. PMI_491]
MRLVNVETFRLEEFIGDAIPSYAILSHTWGADADEVSFRDIEHANSEGLANRHIKLAGCCRQARLDRLQYVWIDTCCIDKANSVELGEAINSMFRWYQNAAVCYAYLSDVPRGGVGPQFPASRWFMRGWTLQELLAPKTLVFYNVDWEPLGSKIELSSLIQEITGIPRPFLSGWAALHEASVAQRMSWASRRITKRKEDEAYSLLGIFGISMAMIYGEGESAFKRLQEEIIKVSSDHSIFAWGLDGSAFDAATSTGVQLGGLLAKSPAEFANCGNIACRKQHTGTRSLFDLSNGYLRIKLPVYALHNGLTYGLLMCGPELEDEKVVGIPLEVENAQSDKSNEEYLRPKGRLCVLLDETIPGAEAKQISISTETQSRSSSESSRHHWFYLASLLGRTSSLWMSTPGRAGTRTTP